MTGTARLLLLALTCAIAAGCESRSEAGPLTWERMRNQPKYQAYGKSAYFPDEMAMRPIPEGAVPEESTGNAADEAALANGTPLTRVPVDVTHDVMQTGQQRYDTFCRPCHDVNGDAETPVAEHMQLRKPPSLLDPRIRALPVGRIFDVISRGYGLMPSYAHQLPPNDRWAVVAYVRALQLRAGGMPLAALPPQLETEAEQKLKAGTR